MSRVLSKIVDTEVEVEITLDEAIEFLEDEGYTVVKGRNFCRDRNGAKMMIDALRDEFGSTIIETDYYHSASVNVPAGSTALIIPGI